MNRRKMGEGAFPYRLTEKVPEGELHIYTEQLEKYGDKEGVDFIVEFSQEELESGGGARPYGVVYTKGTRLNKEGVI